MQNQCPGRDEAPPFTLVFLAAFCALALTVRAAEIPPPTFFQSFQQEVRAVFEKCGPAVVRIEAVDNQGCLSGTGFFIDPNGTLYTSYTVGGESWDIVVTHGESKYPATRLVADPRCGVAVLKVEARTAFIPLATAHDLAVAAPVMTIGYPMELPLTPSFGLIGGFDRKYLGRYFATTHIRANVPVQRGQGGAPLLNLRGEAVGVLISSLDQGSATFALPIEAAEKVRRDFMRFGEVRPGWLGIEIGPTAAPVGGSTARVHEVIADGPAHKGGLEPGDVLLQVGATAITSPEDVLDAAFFVTAEDEVTLRLLRAGEPLELKIEPVELPSAPRVPHAVVGSASDLRGAPLKIGE